jgi:sigma54-dependent transcription regulator
LGGKQEVESDFRLVAATNRGLDEMIQRGQFRSDLLFPLRSFTIDLPLLMEHPEDIRDLAVNNFGCVAWYTVSLLELGRTNVSKNIPLVGSALDGLEDVYREVDTMLTEVSTCLPEFKH